MAIVYILRCQKIPAKHYVGFTKDLMKRLEAHNALKSSFSKKYSPWEVETYITFKNEVKARVFEKYLKHGSGHAFLKKNLI